MDTETKLRCLSYLSIILANLVIILANLRKAREEINVWWNYFTKFLQTLGGPVEVDTDGSLFLTGRISYSVKRGGGATGAASCRATLS
jgi:hypothetical protein